MVSKAAKNNATSVMSSSVVNQRGELTVHGFLQHGILDHVLLPGASLVLSAL